MTFILRPIWLGANLTGADLTGNPWDEYVNYYTTDVVSINMRNVIFKKLVWSFKFTFRYIAAVLSVNNYKFGDFVDRIYPTELEIKDSPLIQLGLLRILTYISKLTRVGNERSIMIKEIISIFPLWTFHL